MAKFCYQQLKDAQGGILQTCFIDVNIVVKKFGDCQVWTPKQLISTCLSNSNTKRIVRFRYYSLGQKNDNKIV